MAAIGFVSDLDGTLLRSDGRLSSATIDMFGTLRRQGVPFVVATARTPRGVRKIAGHEVFGRMVCANGAVVWDAGRNEVIWDLAFDGPTLADAVARVSEALPDAGLAILSARTSFLDATSVALRGTGPKDSVPLTDPGTVVSTHRIVMVAVRHATLRSEELCPIVSAAFAGAGLVTFSGLGAVEVAPLGMTKAVTVAVELDRLGCPPACVVAFGDMPNDLAMLAWAGHGCAVANGHSSVLAAADEIAPSNDDDGVARTVHRFLDRFLSAEVPQR